MLRRLALVRQPSPRLADGIVTHIDRESVDPVLARDQWEAYVGALRANGWDIVQAPAAPDCPDGVFIEDQVLVYGDLALLCRSGAPERRAEQDGLAGLLTDVGYRVARIEAPGLLDGGDVLKHDGRVWVGDAGSTGRSNRAGVEQVADLLAPLGARVEAVPLSGVLHLKSAVTALPDGRILAGPSLSAVTAEWPGWGTSSRGASRLLAVPEESGAHVVILDADTVLLAASAPQTAEVLTGQGLRVVTVDISEFEKLEGCVTCLSVRLRR
ncbi:MAG: N(G),N(G)-dimethylarginine dimethylaminohydrolase [Actinomycetales bacterium]|uniref:N(G),N(G)-dimethylarginine dimethylaminohydrolase n=1 Tax=Candidatus Phosphoribacter hodrii TaxID=2953743 RepID=A0A935IKV9_9MICO|nr:N(G),N(G)-dimethylarginine dimethylaminohydrolase [Candidatus Phosphoribacter hodrii]HRC63721.1 N(G),N(G)-dimethylarginine dimethylaminohydrolase [Dermatophilaceae bacterium]